MTRFVTLAMLLVLVGAACSDAADDLGDADDGPTTASVATADESAADDSAADNTDEGDNSAETTSPTIGAVTATGPPTLLPSCAVEGSVLDVEVADGVIYFVGEFASARAAGAGPGDGQDRGGIGACDLATGELLDFDPGPANGAVRAVASDGTWLYVGGNFTSIGSVDRARIVRVDLTTGEVDPEWGPTVAGGVRHVSVTDDGKIYVGGRFTKIDGLDRRGLVRLFADGQVDTRFAPTFTPDRSNFASVLTVAAGADGALVIGGEFAGVNGVDRPALAVVDRDTGQRTAAFAPDLSDENPADGEVQVYGVLLVGDQVVACGDWWSTEGRGDKDAQRNVGRFDLASGAADAAWEPSTDGGIRACVHLPERGQVLVGGHFDSVDGEAARKSATVDLATAVTDVFLPADSVKGVQTLESAGDLVVLGGTFTRIDGVDQPGLAVVGWS